MDISEAESDTTGKLRKLIDGLPDKPKPKKNGRTNALLPRSAGYREAENEPEPDEEEDDWE